MGEDEGEVLMREHDDVGLGERSLGDRDPRDMESHDRLGDRGLRWAGLMSYDFADFNMVLDARDDDHGNHQVPCFPYLKGIIQILSCLRYYVINRDMNSFMRSS